MPITRAAARQLRKDRAHALRNRARRSELKTLKKQLLGLLDERRWDEAKQLLPRVVKRVDQAASKGLFHARTASRTKSRLMRRLARGAPGSGTG